MTLRPFDGRIDDRERTDRFRRRASDERQVGEREAVAGLEVRLLLVAELRDLRHVDFMDGGDMRRGPLARTPCARRSSAACCSWARYGCGPARPRHAASGWELAPVRVAWLARRAGGSRVLARSCCGRLCALRGHVGFDVGLGDASARAGAFHLLEVDVVLPRHLADQRRERTRRLLRQRGSA